MTGIVVLLVLIAIILLIYAAAGIRIVRPYQRGIVEQLGKYKQTVDPGLRIIIPFIQTMRLVDMREQVVDVPPQEVITSDNVVVAVDAVIYYEPTDPKRLVYNVANFMMAVTKLAQTNLRNVIGDMQLDEALTSRDKINTELREILDDATDKWGVRRPGGDPADRPAARRHGRHARADEGRADPAGHRHVRRRRAPGRGHPGRGRPAGRRAPGRG